MLDTILAWQLNAYKKKRRIQLSFELSFFCFCCNLSQTNEGMTELVFVSKMQIHRLNSNGFKLFCSSVCVVLCVAIARNGICQNGFRSQSSSTIQNDIHGMFWIESSNLYSMPIALQVAKHLILSMHCTIHKVPFQIRTRIKCPS